MYLIGHADIFDPTCYRSVFVVLFRHVFDAVFFLSFWIYCTCFSLLPVLYWAAPAFFMVRKINTSKRGDEGFTVWSILRYESWFFSSCCMWILNLIISNLVSCALGGFHCALLCYIIFMSSHWLGKKNLSNHLTVHGSEFHHCWFSQSPNFHLLLPLIYYYYPNPDMWFFLSRNV